MKICPYPFSRIEYGPGWAVPCCPSWLKTNFFDLKTIEPDAWNSEALVELRKRILEGDYALCDREKCQIPLLEVDEIKAGVAYNSECLLSTTVIGEIQEKKSLISSGPSSISLAADKRCNLACPSCRSRKMSESLGEDWERYLDQVINELQKYRGDIIVIKIAGDGEALFSPWYREVFRIISSEHFPSIKGINLLTNGLLLTPSTMSQLGEGGKLIREIWVSVDAGDEKTYKDVRGGDWSQLLKNLEYASSLRRAGTIDRLELLFVPRKSNYQTMEKAVELGIKLGVDLISFNTLSDWHSKAMNYLEEAVHFKSHPQYKDFKRKVLDLIKNPNVNFNIEL